MSQHLRDLWVDLEPTSVLLVGYATSVAATQACTGFGKLATDCAYPSRNLCLEFGLRLLARHLAYDHALVRSYRTRRAILCRACTHPMSRRPCRREVHQSGLPCARHRR